MEIAIPLIALGGMYIVSNQSNENCAKKEINQLRKENFTNIAPEIVQHWGDVFMYRMHEKLGRVNQTLHNWVVATPMRVTTAAVPEIGGIIQKDWEVAESVFNKYGLTTK
jgi:hypothetical protein